LAAAALHPDFKLCRGIEILPGISSLAKETLEKCRLIDESDMDENKDEAADTWVANESGFNIKERDKAVLDDSNDQRPHDAKRDEIDGVEYYLPATNGGEDVERLKLAPIEFSCGSFEDPYEYFGDADCVFVFSSCMSSALMQSLSKAIGRQCKPGTIAITTEFPLELELLEARDGYCWLTGGASTAYFHRVVESLWEGGKPSRPKLSKEDIAFRAVKTAEEGDAQLFLRNVRNQMMYNGFPDKWLPKIDDT
jgi:hypothetical protein